MAVEDGNNEHGFYLKMAQISWDPSEHKLGRMED
jgi:hypothetical protein